MMDERYPVMTPCLLQLLLLLLLLLLLMLVLDGSPCVNTNTTTNDDDDDGTISAFAGPVVVDAFVLLRVRRRNSDIRSRSFFIGIGHDGGNKSRHNNVNYKILQQQQLQQMQQMQQDDTTTITDAGTDNIIDDDDLYYRKKARSVRTLEGHDAAVPLYQTILDRCSKDNDDMTAATYIAACSQTPSRQDKACQFLDCDDDDDSSSTSTRGHTTKHRELHQLREILKYHNYTHSSICDFFGVPRTNQESNDYTDMYSNLYCEGPLFVRPARSGSVLLGKNYPLSTSSPSTSTSTTSTTTTTSSNPKSTGLECLIALFLIGLVVPTQILQESLGCQAIDLMQEFGWIFPSFEDIAPEEENDNRLEEGMMVPYVHVFPLSFSSQGTNQSQQSSSTTTTIWITTDLHPNILQTTKVGTTSNEEDTVMYIGPDSLALAQHFEQSSKLAHQWEKSAAIGNHDDCKSKNQATSSPVIRGLDLCTGSGIQALTALVKWKEAASQRNSTGNLHMTVVDINPRALRFALFNAYLNGFTDIDIDTVHADLVSQTILDEEDDDNNNNDNRSKSSSSSSSSLHDYRLFCDQRPFHLVLSNPPFIPVPDSAINDDNLDNEAATFSAGSASSLSSRTINNRYGFFSSGGSSGEVVLQRVVEIASRCLEPDHGVLGVVSEFFETSNDPEFHRINRWWDEAGIHNGDMTCASGSGILFVNEYPITPETYALRRADDDDEMEIWLNHLTRLNVTSASPGLLYILKQRNNPSSSSAPCSERIDSSSILRFQTGKVPRSEKRGSIWTPSNHDAIQFTKSTARNIWFESSPTN